jgi:hypothetical protein
MEIMQAKLPWLSADWTVARGMRYAAKLGVFVIVPGLHQISLGRWILGSLLFALLVVSLFIPANEPLEVHYQYNIPLPLYQNLGYGKYIALLVAWMALVFDLKNLDRRSIKPLAFLMIPGIAAYLITQNHEFEVITMHVEPTNTLCPLICKNDIVKWEFYERDKETLSIEDVVVLNGFSEGQYTTRILSDFVTQACAEDDRTSLMLPVGNEFCNLIIEYPGQTASGSTYSGISLGGRKYYYHYDYLVAGRLKNPFGEPVKYLVDRKISMINQYVITGVRPKKIGTASDYFFYSDEVTNIIARSLLHFYKWTGIVLFDLRSN